MIKLLKKVVRSFLVRRRFPTAVVANGATVDSESQLGKHSVVFLNTSLVQSSLGDYSYIQKNSEVVCTSIGKFCSIASNVSIGLANHPITFLSTSPVLYDNTQPLPFFFVEKKCINEKQKKTVVGHDVWIGQGAMIKSGVTIGVGAVVAAGAMVTKDVESYSIVAGVPAKLLRYRFDEELRASLMSSKWWDMDEDKLRFLSSRFEDPKSFVAEVTNQK